MSSSYQQSKKEKQDTDGKYCSHRIQKQAVFFDVWFSSA